MQSFTNLEFRILCPIVCRETGTFRQKRRFVWALEASPFLREPYVSSCCDGSPQTHEQSYQFGRRGKQRSRQMGLDMRRPRRGGSSGYLL
ncbi:hypothetical protein SLA2020_273690 [Shorea laevis]